MSSPSVSDVRWGTARNPLAVGLVILLALERLAELRVARRHAEIARLAGAVETGQGHYPVMVALHSSLLVATAAESWRVPRPRVGGGIRVALCTAAAAQALRWWCIRSLGTAWNTRVLVIPGAELSARGPYRFLKHPNYVAVVAEGLAFPLACGAPRTALAFTLLNAPLLRVRLRAENAALALLAAPASDRPLP